MRLKIGFIGLILLLIAGCSQQGDTLPPLEDITLTIGQTQEPAAEPTNAVDPLIVQVEESMATSQAKEDASAEETPANEEEATNDASADVTTPTYSPIMPVLEPAVPLLPSPLYFIGTASGQIVRLERDGFTLTRITDETAPVEAFDVDAAADLLVLVSNNELHAITMSTGERRLLVSGDNVETFDYASSQILRRIIAPEISPDGTQVVFGLDGIQIATLGEAVTVELLLPSDELPDFSDPEVEIPEGPLRIFGSASWSPDGSQLAVSFGYFPESGGVGLLDVATGQFTDMTEIAWQNGAVGCCEWAWSADGSRALIASDLVVYGSPGLASVDAVSQTVTPLISADDQSETFTLVRAPIELPDGSVWAFAGQADFEFFDSAFYQLQRIGSAGALTPTQVGDVIQMIRLGRDVLWAEDGSGVVINELSGMNNSGSVVRWLDPLQNNSVALPVSGSNFRWDGSLAAVSETVASADLERLESIGLADLNAFAGIEFAGIATMPLLGPGQPRYAVYSVGSRSYDPITDHVLAVYEWSADGWTQLAIRRLTGSTAADDIVSEGGGPDYLFAGSAQQAYIEPTNQWIYISGGVGAHSGTSALIRFDGMSLMQEAIGFSSTPSSGWVEDLNGDGTDELILNQTDPYVFCYACGVRLVNYDILRWTGSALEPVELTTLSAEAGVPEEMLALNNEVVRLAEAGLWLEASTLAAPLTVSGHSQVRWNGRYVLLMADGRGMAAESAYPIMTRMFNGDYTGAVVPFFELSGVDMFNPDGPLFFDTVASGWEEGMFRSIIDTTSAALDVQPDNAGATFLRGWAKYMLDNSDVTAIDDLNRAALLDPESAVFSTAAAHFAP